MLDYRNWVKNFICTLVFFLLVVAGLNGIIDPFFHYHKPLTGMSYRIEADNSRYQNDGIIKNFDYNAVIIGTSMTQNFRVSELNDLFGVNAIKVPFSGASTREISQNIETVFISNDDVKMIVWGLDYSLFFENYLNMKYYDYPTYLYDDSIFNDVNYLLNKTVFLNNTLENVIIYTLQGRETTSFDEYSRWNEKYEFGKDAVLKDFDRAIEHDEVPLRPLDDTNIIVNILGIIEEHPNTQFYLFWTPYSIIYYDDLHQKGQLQLKLNWELEALELLLNYDNVHFYSFNDCYDIITDLENYKDYIHYSGDVNDYIIKCMSTGEHEITMENYREYWDDICDFYLTYDYDDIWK